MTCAKRRRSAAVLVLQSWEDSLACSRTAAIAPPVGLSWNSASLDARNSTPAMFRASAQMNTFTFLLRDEQSIAGCQESYFFLGKTLNPMCRRSPRISGVLPGLPLSVQCPPREPNIPALLTRDPRNMISSFSSPTDPATPPRAPGCSRMAGADPTICKDGSGSQPSQNPQMLLSLLPGT